MQSTTSSGYVMNETHVTESDALAVGINERSSDQDEQIQPILSRSLFGVNQQQASEIKVVIPADSSAGALSPPAQQEQTPADDKTTLHDQLKSMTRWSKRVVGRCSRACMAKQQQKPPADISETLKSLTDISKILAPISFGVILATLSLDMEKLTGTPAHNWIRYVEIPTQDAAALLMILGMHQQRKQPRLSKWLQDIGHLLCLEGFFLMQVPFLRLPLRLIPIPLGFIAVLIGAFKLSQ